MGAMIAEALGGDLDIVLVRKLGYPGNPEYAIGAVDEQGTVSLNEDTAGLHIPRDYIERESHQQMQLIRERRSELSAVHQAIDPRGRTVLLIDDGTATGLTMLAALQSIRAQTPLSITALLPVAPPDALHRIERASDETICLQTPEHFQAISQFYENFPQMSDEEMLATLAARKPHAPRNE